MRYTTSIEMDLPREKVVQLISDPPQMPKWLRSLVPHEPVVHYDREIVGGVGRSRHML